MDQISAQRFEQLEELYVYWNERINVISRKDLPNLYINHILHSLSLAKLIRFIPGENALDLGTGGGFPGIPLAILNPDVKFTLLDARGKKIKVVEDIAVTLSLNNVKTVHARAEEFMGTYNYIFSRAVGSFSRLVELSGGKLIAGGAVRDVHGLYSLKGGDLSGELVSWKNKIRIYNIGAFFQEEYFQTKSIVFLPAREFPLS
jgi:16S rRNA (guanine527-N7)-methyltransferase